MKESKDMPNGVTDRFSIDDTPLLPAPKRPKVYQVESREKQAKLTKKEIATLEKEVEDYFVKRVKECDLEQRKLNPSMCKGIADRLVWSPSGLRQPRFVELKRPKGGVISPLQHSMAKGLNYLFLTSKEEVEYFLRIYFPENYNPTTPRTTKE